MEGTLDRDFCELLDARDPLAGLRDRFRLPDGVVYLDGNSLGPLTHAARRRLLRALDDEWGGGLISSWFEGGWLEAPTRIGDRIAPLIGADRGEVVVADSTTVNLFKLAVAGLSQRPDRSVVLIDPDDFPTDRYIAAALSNAMGRPIEVRGISAERVTEGIDEHVALVLLTHVDYRTGLIHDMSSITEAVHAAGALMLWDLSHTVGAIPCSLSECDVDLAVGCTYKFLNGGPGAPAFLYVPRRLQGSLVSPIPGWFGHARPFDFAAGYEPAAGIARFLAGTSGILGMASLEGALEVWDEVSIGQVREKSIALGDLLIRLLDERCAGLGVEVVSPRDGTRRGSQVSLRLPEAETLVRRLSSRRILADFRPSDIVRLGLAPLYTTHVDVWIAIEAVRAVLLHLQQAAAPA